MALMKPGERIKEEVMAQDTTAFFGGSIPAIKFNQPGDKIVAKVTAKELRQQRDMDTNTLLTWDDGRPKLVAVLTVSVAPEYRDGAGDDGRRNLYVRGYMQRAFVEAIRDANLNDLPLGATIEVEFTKRDEPTEPGRDGAKLFEVKVTP